jgi:predicted RNA-binding protein with RPS1 domain
MLILGIMEKILPRSRGYLRIRAKILTIKSMRIRSERSSERWQDLKSIAEQSGAEINIENDGTVTIYGKNRVSAQKAMDLVKSIVEEPEVGRIYTGTVKRIMDFGAFIEILPGKEGLCHISKLAKTRVNNVNDVLSVNQVIPVKLVEVDRMGRLNLKLCRRARPQGIATGMCRESSVTVRVLTSSRANIPFYASEEAAGADLCAALSMLRSSWNLMVARRSFRPDWSLRFPSAMRGRCDPGAASRHATESPSSIVREP